MLSDSWYVAGTDKMVKLLLKNNVKTYMYVLNYTIEGLNWPEWRGEYLQNYINFVLIYVQP